MSPHIVAFIILVYGLTACSLAPDLTVPTQDIPSDWRHAPAAAEGGRQISWEDFGSAELNSLITQALTNNTDLAAALARVEQSRALATIAGSGLYPQIGFSGSASRNRSSGEFSGSNTSAQAGLDIAYELDIWQRNRNQGLAADYRLKATEFDRQALALIVTAETARLYTGTVALQKRLEVAERNLVTFQDVLRITEVRHKSGSISGLELAQQRTSVANAKASTAVIANQYDLFINQLAVMTGVAPSRFKVAITDLESLKIPAINVGDPWRLLARRPDIAGAEAVLKATTIDIGVARANALPSLQLRFGTHIASDPVTRTTSLVASFFAPILQGGALQADIDRSEAARNEAMANYRSVLLTSLREVEDALTNFSRAEERLAAFTTAAEESRRAYGITRAQYDVGSVDFQALLNTQRSLLQAEDAQVNARQELFAASIDLFRAMGGEFSAGLNPS